MQTISSADKALKTLYLGVISEQMNTGVNPLLAKIKQSTNDVWGKEIKKLAQHGVNGGVGAGSEIGALPTPAENNYDQFTLELKNLYGTISISDKAIRASANNAGAFVNLLNAEMEGLIKAASFNFGRMLYGDGSGIIAELLEIRNGFIYVDKIRNFYEGMVVDIIENGQVIPGGKGRRVLSVSRYDNSVLLSGEPITTSNVNIGSFLTVQNSYNKEITGLEAIFQKTGSLYGLDRETHRWLIPYINDNVGELTESTLQAAIDEIEEVSGGRINFIVCSAGVKRAFVQYLSTFRRNIDIMNIQGGSTALSFNGIPIVSDRFCPDGTMYLLNTDDFTLHQLCDWRWLEGEDGRVLKQVAGTPTYTATLVKYADLICARPCAQGVLKNVAEI